MLCNAMHARKSQQSLWPTQIGTLCVPTTFSIVNTIRIAVCWQLPIVYGHIDGQTDAQQSMHLNFANSISMENQYTVCCTQFEIRYINKSDKCNLFNTFDYYYSNVVDGCFDFACHTFAFGCVGQSAHCENHSLCAWGSIETISLDPRK